MSSQSAAFSAFSAFSCPQLPHFPRFGVWNLLSPLLSKPKERDLPHFPHSPRIGFESLISKIRPTGWLYYDRPQVTRMRGPGQLAHISCAGLKGLERRGPPCEGIFAPFKPQTPMQSTKQSTLREGFRKGGSPISQDPPDQLIVAQTFRYPPYRPLSQ